MSETPATNEAYRMRKRHRQDDESDWEHWQRLHPLNWTKNLLDLYNNKYLSRTPYNWWRLLLFYVLFMAGLVALFAFNMFVFLHNLDELVPRVLLKQPGFSMSPCLMLAGVCAIDYRLSNESAYFAYTNRINQTLQKYVDDDTSDRFGPCQWEGEFGFANGMPCLFLKVNRIIGFQPETYDDPGDLPVPDLKRFVATLEPARNRRNKVWLSCQTNNLDVNVNYYPTRFVHQEAVYLRQKVIRRQQYVLTIREDGQHVALNHDKIFYDRTDMERVVAVQLTRFPRNVQVMLTCYLWAQNIERVDEGTFNHGRIHIGITIRP